MDLGLDGKVAVITGGGGAICGEIAIGLAREGARVAIWDLSLERAEATAAATGGIAVGCDATDRDSIKNAVAHTTETFGGIDILVNGAGGSHPSTTTSDELSFFDIESDAMQRVISLNYLSSVIASQEVGRAIAERGAGAILNIASIAGINPLTRALSYSDGKAAVVSFTKWLSVHMARTYTPKIRVNAVAPGFVLTDQNRFLLVEENGTPTERGNTILEQVPLMRLGEPKEIVGAALWLVSDAASFVTGAVIPVDGGYSAFSGV